MSGVPPLIVTPDVDGTRPCDQRRSSVDKDHVAVRPVPAVDVLSECDEPSRRLPKGRMRYPIHQAVIEGRLPTVNKLDY